MRARFCSKRMNSSTFPMIAAFECFVKSGAELAIGQGLQDSGINEYDPRMMERTDQIFARNQIDSGLPPDGSIHLRQHRCGDLHEFDSAHI